MLDDPVQFVNSASAAQMTQGVEDLSGLTDAMVSFHMSETSQDRRLTISKYSALGT